MSLQQVILDPFNCIFSNEIMQSIANLNAIDKGL